ncbi:adenosylcobinamide hydrolase [Haladaptatus litoreus]|uniref:Adenosylcobinamide hydrolase n=1 Tax=Haladaptatus litoreus TaxID=553468 RepID=A0A1N7CSF4_9EURY|nr:adenosylcobinamide amidohydrolase [Haladaptatus litoreus]SIR66608.1 adenosylcobinamide hydrolase [Haladaptatus litoreus]
MFETTVRNAVLRLARPETRWLSSGWSGGFTDANAAYNISVPEGFERTDLDAYIDERRTEARFDRSGPTLLTGVDLRHARGARCGSVEAVVTAGISNPAALPIDSNIGTESLADAVDEGPNVGTVNIILGTSHALDDGSLATLLSVAVEAKTATLLAETGFPGTTTDAVIAACDPSGEEETFAGSGTSIGAAARACVRDAVQASLRSRYATRTIPSSVEEAEYGVTTTVQSETFRP